MTLRRKVYLMNHSLLRFFASDPCKTATANNETTKAKLIKNVAPQDEFPNDKVTIVGLGSVGVAIAFTLLTQNVSNNIVLVDTDERRLRGEKLDLQQASIFRGNFRIETCTDYTKTACSKVCVITAGARQKPDESRLNLVQRNADIIKVMVPQLVKQSPDTILLLITNPVDIMTYITWKISGLPSEKVIGSGTHLDTSRFRFFLSERFGVSPSQCHGYIIGEHGDTSVAVWSSVNVGGVRLRDLNPEAGTSRDKENWADIHKRVINSAYELIKLKGYTSWAIGLSATSIINSILRNALFFQPVSLNAKGFYGIKDDLYMSLPTFINSNGVSLIMKKNLDSDEQKKLLESVKVLGETQKSITI